MKRSVGLIVAVHIPSVDGKPQLAVVLQRRGDFDFEKCRPETNPGCLQVTCHGKLEEGEDFPTALAREAQEELGVDFKDLWQGYRTKILAEVQTPDKEVVTYGTMWPIHILRRNFRLNPSSGGLVFVTADQIEDIVEITDSLKEKGPEYRSTLAMFPDEIEAVKKAFEVFGAPREAV